MLKPRTQTKLLTRFKGRALTAVALVAILGGTLNISTINLAYAASCSGVTECKKGSKVANLFLSTTVDTALLGFRLLVEGYLTMLKDSLTRLSNQGSNNVQNNDKTQSSLGDRVNSQATATAIGGWRAEQASQLFPSRTACRTESNANRASTAQYSRSSTRTRYSATQRAATDYASNAPGGPTERGTIQAISGTFKDIMNGFCDPAIMNPPTGVNCTLETDSSGQSMAFRYTQPSLAIFGVPNGTISPDTNSPDNRAARLFARMAIEPVPIDPLRGPILVRQEGQGSFVFRQSDIAAFNLARGALDRMVDDRIGTTASGDESVEYLRQRAWANASGLAKDAIDRAAQPSSANADDLAPMIADVNKIYLQIYNNLERLAAIKATQLARVVVEDRGAGVGVVGRATGN